MPTPTARRFTPRPAPSAHACLPRTAAAVSTSAKPIASGRANTRRSTLMPISTKKTGTSSAPTGASNSSSVRSPRRANGSKCNSSSTSPAANAPMMGASPTSEETHAIKKQNATADATSTPRPSKRPAPRNSDGTT